MASAMEFFRKWTPILPPTLVNSDPFEVTSFKTISMKAYMAGFLAAGPLALQVEGSDDLVIWDNIGAAQNLAAPGAFANWVVTDPPKYVRVTANPNGGSMTFFCIGVGREN